MHHFLLYKSGGRGQNLASHLNSAKAVSGCNDSENGSLFFLIRTGQVRKRQKQKDSYS